MTDTPKPAPATPAATPLREANQQRVNAAVQRVRQDLEEYPADDEFRKDVELLIEIALAPVLEIFAAAQPATAPGSLEEWLEAHRVALDERQLFVVKSFIVLNYIPAAQPQRESEQP